MTKHLKWALSFDFIASHSLDECDYRLGLLQEIRDIAFAPTIQIHRHTHKNDSLAFTIIETQPADIVISGYMTYLEAEKTFISGSVYLQPHSRWEALPPALALLCMGPFLGVGAVIGGLGLWWWFVQRYQRGTAREAARLVQLLKDVLYY